MLKYMKRLTILLLMSLLTGLTAYSQTAGLNSKGDTTITFTTNQAKYLLKQVYKAKEYQRLDSICEAQRELQQEIITDQKQQIVDQTLINNNNNELLQVKQIELTNQKAKTDEAKKETRKQKFQKWTVIVISGAVVAFETYLLVIKK